MFVSKSRVIYKRAVERSPGEGITGKRQEETFSFFLPEYFQTRFFILCKISLIKNEEDYERYIQSVCCSLLQGSKMFD